MHHGVTFNFLVYSPAIFETSFSYDKDIWIAATDYYLCSVRNLCKKVNGCWACNPRKLKALVESCKFY